MHSLPHQYNVQAKGQPDNNLQVCVKNIAALNIAPPS
jgi:hypothetical protein